MMTTRTLTLSCCSVEHGRLNGLPMLWMCLVLVALVALLIGRCPASLYPLIFEGSC
jgi:hypothetical protein